MRFVDWIIFPAALGASFMLTALLRRYALANQLVDMPNQRSSHKVPTPRGGGVAIAATFLLGLPVLWWSGLLDGAVLIGVSGAGALVAFIGYLDDRYQVPARWRLLVHTVSATWGLGWISGVPAISFLGYSVTLGWIGWLIALLYLVWLLNLYNFMDGIDGIASIEAATVCTGAALLHWLVVPTHAGWALPLLLLFSALGFLVWNVPPAKIFMGDSGSGFLGLTMGMLSIIAAWHVPALFWSWVILLGVFIVDATVTLVRRVYRGEKFYVAHRTHAYQYASRRHGSHAPVTTAVGLINLLWLLPIALLVGLGRLEGGLGLCVAYAPLLWLAYRFKAGARELQEGQA
jgi:Fuc2NAc and GlcNAc transferase